MGIEFPITVGAFLSVFGVAFATALLVTWLKDWLTEKRVYNVVALGIAEVAALLVQLVASQWKPDGAAVISAVLIGFFGASLACYGYETLQNLLGLIGYGKRSDAAIHAELLRQGEEMMSKAGRAQRG